MTKIAQSFSIVLLVSLILGCDSSKDLSKELNYWGGYQSNSEYLLNMDVYILSVATRDGLDAPYSVSPHGSFHIKERYFTAPTELNFATSDTNLVTGRRYQIESTVIGILERGTSIRVTKVIRYVNRSMFFGKSVNLEVFGVVSSGPHNGKLVNLLDVSESFVKGGEELRKPNNDLLVPAVH